ncbi:MAG TPA: tetratricopeptide repeat protein [Blastocatellia bacterium]|nr:tetratricopeptide repeat protein [Blastocatellia bacterium]
MPIILVMLDLEQERQRTRLSLERALERFYAGKYDAALQELETTLVLESDNGPAHSFAAACLLRLGRIEEAEERARTGLAVTPESGVAHVFMAEVLSARGRFEEAESEMIEALSLNPLSAGMHLELARFLIGRHRYEEARIRAARAVELAPDDGDAHMLLGVSLGCLDRHREAGLALERALLLKPVDDAVLYLNGAHLIIQGDSSRRPAGKILYYRKAIELLNRAIEINPSNESAIKNLEAATRAVRRQEGLVKRISRARASSLLAVTFGLIILANEGVISLGVLLAGLAVLLVIGVRPWRLFGG